MMTMTSVKDLDMTNQELVDCIKRGYLEALSNDNNELSKFALFSYFATAMDEADVDSTTIDISDFMNGKYGIAYEDFQNAVIRFIKNYK